MLYPCLEKILMSSRMRVVWIAASFAWGLWGVESLPLLAHVAAPQSERESRAGSEPPTAAERLVEELEQPSQVGDFHGFVQHRFPLAGVGCTLVVPQREAAGRPWIWRARFWGHQPQLDVALLKQGWHVAYCDVANLYGNDAALARWDRFYELSQRLGLHPRPVLEGMSRGGLIVMRWATANPQHVGGVYLDNAVLDMRSWPGGSGTGKGSAADWQRCLAAYGLTAEQAAAFADGPLDRLADLAAAQVPLFALINEADEVVPPAENADPLVERYKGLGGPIEVLRRPGLGHHPHSLADPAPLVRFATRAIER